MRPQFVLILSALCLVSVACGSKPAIALQRADLAVARIAQGADSTQVRALLGTPQQASADTAANEAGFRLAEWQYPDLTITFDEDEKGQLFAIAITGRSFKTQRGLAIGDPVRRLRQLYGEPAETTQDSFLYQVNDDPSRMLGMQVVLEDSLVTWIRVGRLMRVG